MGDFLLRLLDDLPPGARWLFALGDQLLKDGDDVVEVLGWANGGGDCTVAEPLQVGRGPQECFGFVGRHQVVKMTHLDIHA
jgi:hypothetical protein